MVGKITWICFNYNYNYNLKISITITIIQVQVIVIQLQFQYNYNEKILKTLRPILLHTKTQVLLYQHCGFVLNFCTSPIKAPILSILALPPIFVYL